jgi:hypothetical protein
MVQGNVHHPSRTTNAVYTEALPTHVPYSPMPSTPLGVNDKAKVKVPLIVCTRVFEL